MANPFIVSWRHRAQTLIAAVVVSSLLASSALAQRAAPSSLFLDDALKTELASLAVMRGGDIDRARLSDRFVVVSFFASWCAPCRKEFIELRRLIAEMDLDRLKVVTINWLEDVTHYPQESLAIYRVLDRLDPHITALEGTAAIARTFGGPDGVRAIPALFAFDPAGQLIYRFQFSLDAEKSHTTADDLREAFGRQTARRVLP